MKNKNLQLGIYIYFMIRGIYYFIMRDPNISFFSIVSIFLLSTLFFFCFLFFKNRPFYFYIFFPVFVVLLAIGTREVASFIYYLYLPKKSLFFIYGSILLLLFYIGKEEKIVFIRTLQIYFVFSFFFYLFILFHMIYKLPLLRISFSFHLISLKAIIAYSFLFAFLIRVYLLFFEKTNVSDYKPTILFSYIGTWLTLLIEKGIESGIYLKKSFQGIVYPFIKILENIHFYHFIDRFDKIFGFLYLFDGFVFLLSSVFLIKSVVMKKRMD